MNHPKCSQLASKGNWKLRIWSDPVLFPYIWILLVSAVEQETKCKDRGCDNTLCVFAPNLQDFEESWALWGCFQTVSYTPASNCADWLIPVILRCSNVLPSFLAVKDSHMTWCRIMSYCLHVFKCFLHVLHTFCPPICGNLWYFLLTMATCGIAKMPRKPGQYQDLMILASTGKLGQLAAIRPMDNLAPVCCASYRFRE